MIDPLFSLHPKASAQDSLNGMLPGDIGRAGLYWMGRDMDGDVDRQGYGW